MSSLLEKTNEFSKLESSLNSNIFMKLTNTANKLGLIDVNTI